MKEESDVTVILIKDFHIRSRNRAGLGVDMDSASADGIPAGPSPMELILHGLAGCTAMDIAVILRKRKRPPEHLQVKISSKRHDQHPKVYTHIHITYCAKGPGVTVEELERAAKLSMETYCSVTAMLKSTAEISWQCELIQ